MQKTIVGAISLVVLALEAVGCGSNGKTSAINPSTTTTEGMPSPTTSAPSIPRSAIVACATDSVVHIDPSTGQYLTTKPLPTTLSSQVFTSPPSCSDVDASGTYAALQSATLADGSEHVEPLRRPMPMQHGEVPQR